MKLFLDSEDGILDNLSLDIDIGLGSYKSMHIDSLYDKNSICLLNGNSLEKRVLNALRGGHKDIISNSSHACLPPDFYSDSRSLMFDVFRVNDTEVSKSYNPLKIKERKVCKEIESFNIFDDKTELYCNCNIDGDYDKIHNIKNYIKQYKRVAEEHLRKIHIWCDEHPNIKYKGILILDETSVYFKGKCYQEKDSSETYFRIEEGKDMFHCPYFDKNFMDILYDCKDLDFVIWYSIYKGMITDRYSIPYKRIVIIDVRYKCNKKYIDYDYSQYTPE